MRNTSIVFMSLALWVGAVRAQTSFPMITHASPVAVQRGKATEITVEGQQNFFGAYKALFEGTGLAGEVLEPKAAADQTRPVVKNVKLKLTVAADAPLGVREFRVASSLGISSVGQIVIVDDPVIVEKAANNTFPQAEAITLPCAVAGRIEAIEDVDYFKFEAQEGQAVTFELYCARIQDKIHDLQKHAKPMLTLYDATGRELAANDSFFFADPMVSYTIPKAGTYFIQVRESTYDGDPRWVYALSATQKPYASHIYPMAGNLGKTIDVEPIGSARLVKPKVSLKVPEQLGVQLVQLDVGGTKTNAATLLVNHLPPVLEVEPNDAEDKATRIAIPAGINGRMAQKRDLDYFVFKADKGKAIQFEVKARRFGTSLNSSIHAVLEVMNAKGAIVASNDDTHGKEAALVFTPPADGDFYLRVRDLNSKGGESFVYHVEADFARPDFALRCDPDKAMIGPGSSTAWYVHLTRSNGFTGPVTIEVKNLPKDITVNPLTIPPTMTQGLLVLTAGPSATHGAANVDIVGTAQIKTPDGKEEAVTRSVTSNQEIYLPGGGRGRFDVNMHTVAVTDPSDILKVEVLPQQITLKPGQEVKIDVTIQRRQDYDKSVTLDILLAHLGGVYGNPLPPGVTVVTGKSKTLLGTLSKGHITIKADANAAPIENVPISVLVHVSINFVVKVSYSSPVILLSVRKD